MDNPKQLSLTIGDLSIAGQAGDERWEIRHPTHGNNQDGYYVAAWINCRPVDGNCDLETVGDRPWLFPNTKPEEFMSFVKIAMDLIKDLYRS